MTPAQLRALQAPLKERYRAEPAAAQQTLTATGRLGDDVSCVVETPRGPVVSGLHPATGGTGALACSGDMLLEALVACAGVTLRAVATAMGIPVEGTIHAEGDLDWRGTLGVSRESPVGFSAIRLRFELETSATPEQKAKLIQLTERYCVIFQTLAKPPALSVSTE
jgi:uncharacterized OsmC-like protein